MWFSRVICGLCPAHVHFCSHYKLHYSRRVTGVCFISIIITSSCVRVHHQPKTCPSVHRSTSVQMHAVAISHLYLLIMHLPTNLFQSQTHLNVNDSCTGRAYLSLTQTDTKENEKHGRLMDNYSDVKVSGTSEMSCTVSAGFIL